MLHLVQTKKHTGSIVKVEAEFKLYVLPTFVHQLCTCPFSFSSITFSTCERHPKLVLLKLWVQALQLVCQLLRCTLVPLVL